MIQKALLLCAAALLSLSQGQNAALEGKRKRKITPFVSVVRPFLSFWFFLRLSGTALPPTGWSLGARVVSARDALWPR